jgi:hypothetical protein
MTMTSCDDVTLTSRWRKLHYNFEYKLGAAFEWEDNSDGNLGCVKSSDLLNKRSHVHLRNKTATSAAWLASSFETV